MGRRGDLRRGDARARVLSGCPERRAAAGQIARSRAINHRLFAPSPLRAVGRAAPLVVALHGCTQTASDFAAGTRFDSVAERVGAYVLYPEQSARANGQRCWNWYLEENQARASGEPAKIVALVDQIIARYPIDRRKVFVAGLSAGGAMAAILGEQAPDRFAAVGIMAGVPLHASRDLESAYAAMRGEVAQIEFHSRSRTRKPRPAGYARLRVTVWAGTDDRVVAPVNASILAGQFLRLVGVDAGAATVEQRSDAEVVRWLDASGRLRVEEWRVSGMGHAWSGGSFRGSHTHPQGPRATEEMMAFFLETGAATPA